MAGVLDSEVRRSGFRPLRIGTEGVLGESARRVLLLSEQLFVCSPFPAVQVRLLGAGETGGAAVRSDPSQTVAGSKRSEAAGTPAAVKSVPLCSGKSGDETPPTVRGPRDGMSL